MSGCQSVGYWESNAVLDSRMLNNVIRRPLKLLIYIVVGKLLSSAIYDVAGESCDCNWDTLNDAVRRREWLFHRLLFRK